MAPNAVLYPPGAKFGPDGRPLKSKLTAGLLGLIFGTLGVHRFYLGYTGIGVLQLLLTLVLWFPTCFVSWAVVGIWALVDSIMCFTGSMTDAEGRPLAD
jgi:TM2 domain-containing membrane protein YozV